MARIAFYKINIPHAGIEEGDPLAVEENGFDFESDDSFGVTFYVIDIESLTKADLVHILLPHLEPALPTDPEINNSDAADRFVNKGFRRWKLDVLKMPANKRSELRNNGILPVLPDIAIMNTWMKDRYLNSKLIK